MFAFGSPSSNLCGLLEEPGGRELVGIFAVSWPPVCVYISRGCHRGFLEPLRAGEGGHLSSQFCRVLFTDPTAVMAES